MQILTLQITCKKILFHFSLAVKKARESSCEQTVLSPSISRKGSREKTRYDFKIYYLSIFCFCFNRILIENSDREFPNRVQMLNYNVKYIFGVFLSPLNYSNLPLSILVIICLPSPCCIWTSPIYLAVLPFSIPWRQRNVILQFDNQDTGKLG